MTPFLEDWCSISGASAQVETPGMPAPRLLLHRGALPVWPSGSEPVSHPPPRRSRTLGIRLVEDRPDGGRDHLLGSLGHQRQRISHQMRAAALPAGALEYRGDRSLQPFVRVASDQLHATKSACHQAAQKGMPERTVLARAYVEAEHFALPILVDAYGDHYRHADDAMLLPDLHEGGVKLNVRVSAIQFARAKAVDFGVQCLTQSADLALRHPRHAKRLDQVVHSAGTDPIHVRLLHDRD